MAGPRLLSITVTKCCAAVRTGKVLEADSTPLILELFVNLCLEQSINKLEIYM